MLQNWLQEWLGLQETLLDELLHHDGWGDFLTQSKCFLCKGKDSIYKCEDCSHGALLKCKACLVSVHLLDPLHQIKVRHLLSGLIVSHTIC